MRPLTVGRLLSQCLILAGFLFCVMVVALKFGAIHVSLYGLGRDLLRYFMGKSTEISSEYSLILNLRLPRIFLGVFVGASLAVAGTSFQALLRNPLADPYVLGVSYGAQALGSRSPHYRLPDRSQDLRQFCQDIVPIIGIFDREFGLAENWIEVEEYFAFVTSLRQKDFGHCPIARWIIGIATRGETTLFLS